MSEAKDVESSNATVFCPQCAVRVPLLPLKTIRTSNDQQPWADIVCPTCRFVIVTIGTDEEGTFSFRSTPSPFTEERAKEAAEKVYRLCEAGASVSIPTLREIEWIIIDAFATTPTVEVEQRCVKCGHSNEVGEDSYMG